MHPARTLAELQEHDLALARLSKQLEEMPEKRTILQARAKIAEIRALKDRTESVVHSLAAGVKRVEDELQSVADKIDVEQAKLLSGEVKNPKELQAISVELAALKRRMEQQETELLTWMEKKETAEAQVAKVDAVVRAGEAKEAHLTAVFKEHGSELLAGIEGQTAARDRLLASLPADLRERYQSVRGAHHGIAVGILADGMCSACRVGLPAGEIDSLEQGPDIGSCPNCGRILVVRGGAVE